MKAWDGLTPDEKVERFEQIISGRLGAIEYLLTNLIGQLFTTLPPERAEAAKMDLPLALGDFLKDNPPAYAHAALAACEKILSEAHEGSKELRKKLQQGGQ